MTRLELATIVGSTAGVITIMSFVPQAIRAWRTKRTQDLSLGTFALIVLQSIAWTAYGVLLEQHPMIWTNITVLFIALTILAAKLRHG